jgi:hypothetical protein
MVLGSGTGKLWAWRYSARAELLIPWQLRRIGMVYYRPLWEMLV